MPDCETVFAPMSEYLCWDVRACTWRVALDHWGGAFERFEIIYTFELLDALRRDRNADDVSSAIAGLVARFWDTYVITETSPYLALREEARRLQETWPPVAAGLCGGSYATFNELSMVLERHMEKRYAAYSGPGQQ